MQWHNPGKVALCFPGKLAKIPDLIGEGMRKNGRSSHPFFEEAWEVGGFDFVSFFLQNEKEDRYYNVKLQLATYLLSMVSYDIYTKKGGVYEWVVEHSMGIYAALVATGAMSFRDGLLMVKGIGLIIERRSAEIPGGLIAVIGLDGETIKKISTKIDEDLYVANVNGSRQFVLAGSNTAINHAGELALEQGAISVQRLPFSTPLHSPLMEPLVEEVKGFVNTFEIRPPRTPIVSHWGGIPLRDVEGIRDFLSTQLCRPVDWEGAVQSLLAEGVNCFIEMGATDTLTKLVRWINRGARAFCYGVRDAV